MRSTAAVLALGFLFFFASCGSDDSNDGGGNETGTIAVTVTTGGTDLDTDGFTITLSNGSSMDVDNNGTATFSSVPAEFYTVTLSNARVTCDPDEGFEQTALVSPGQTRSLTFTVECTAKPIVFSSNRDEDYGIFRMNPDGSGIRKVIDNGVAPLWSPDGMRIAYIGLDDQVYVMNDDGTDNTAIFTGENITSWSPDGMRLVTVIDDQIYTLNPDGSDMTQITDLPGDVFYVDWGPATNPKIIFSYDAPEDAGDGIYMMDDDGSNIEQVTNNLDDFAVWSNSGTMICFTRYVPDGDRLIIYTKNMPNGDEVRRTGIIEDEMMSRWSPDDSQLTFVTVLTDILGNTNREVCIGSATSAGATNLSQSGFDDILSDWR